PPAPPPILARYALAGGYGVARHEKNTGLTASAGREWVGRYGRIAVGVARWYFRRVRQNKRDRNQFTVRWLSDGTFRSFPGM
ncbi:hypothetical protein, partial [Bradyrhizobium sp. 23]|uniref:hypothetical protein n=1 Tax=Bradyrhizobium sp. 23 TaxID=2782667 RepID=UPI001FF8F38F